MAFAIFASLVALVLTAAIIVVVLNILNKTRSENIGVKKSASTIRSVGVKSTLGEYMPKHANHGNAAAAAAGKPVVVPGDSLKSRFAAMAALAAAIFGTLYAKLFSMQILSGREYAEDSEENRFSVVSTPAPRGYIYDANGVALVKNKSSLTVLADPDVADDRDVLLRLSAVLGVPYNVIRKRVQDSSSGAQSQRVVSSNSRMRDIAFISEHADAFPGVTIETRALREYPYGALGAHALGYTGTVSEEELKNVAEGRDIKLGDDVGKGGVEATYDNLLAGDHGERKVMADSKGNIVEVVSETQPTRGSDIYLTIKGPVQYVCDRILANMIAPDGVIGSGTGTAGAIVVLDAKTGGVVAMSSYPTYAPATFTGGIPQDAWDLYNTDESYYPLMNRTISGAYPAASTYKAFTSLAALEYGFATEKTEWTCTGSWDGWNTGQPQKCWDLDGHGTLDLYGGIVNSCDPVFYEIAKNFFDNREDVGETAMQDFIHKFRFGEYTGIDLSGEVQGRIPTPEWKAEHFKDYPEEAVWRGGDMTNMVIGQGYVLTTPLQIACAYTGVATGTIMKPHLLKEVRNTLGETVLEYQPEVITEIDVDKDDLAYVRNALRGVATDNSNIARAFAEYGIDAACKTGTAEVAGKDNYAWFATYAPYEDPQYVVATIIEQGGSSDVTVPIGAEVLNACFACDRGDLTEIGWVAGSTGQSVEYQVSSVGRND